MLRAISYLLQLTASEKGCNNDNIIVTVLKMCPVTLTLLHSERPKSYTILVFLSAIGLRCGKHTVTII